MAGHSKFKNIMHRKGAQDKKRAKLFSRLGKEISVAVKESGPDPDKNIRLRSAVSNAKALNMPKDNIERAIKKGEGNDPDSYFEEVRYEGYGPDGVAIIVEAMTNNKNRTAAEIRATFNKYGGNLGESGSVSFGFKRLGGITIDKSLTTEEDLFDFIADNGSENYEVNDDEYNIYCDQKKLHQLNEKINSKYGQTKFVGLIWKSENNISIGKDSAEKLFKLLNVLEDNEDVQNVSSNFEVTDEILSSLNV
ncbi:MAG: YebC/PmpR family DNA-binding transcriptional regulator [Pelagibacteraceae bacterium]|nr:YebC/PmpR family DNA-binding transcriptional regulator [Pelagibacteraceae bacterium]|tara:strand:+ start:14757 stop:15506 length:750 start_codon:yes stop_codon:yes gene_type:complete